MAPFWGWYMLRSRAVWFFTPSNPKLTFGGMEGEPKREMYDLLPLNLYPTTFNILPSQSFDEVLQQLNISGIQYPLIVKPEIGGQGILFRKIDDEGSFKHYHSLVPVEYIVQKMVHYPIEVSVFHIRHPKEMKGIITGFLHKIPLQVWVMEDILWSNLFCLIQKQKSATTICIAAMQKCGTALYLKMKSIF